MYGVSRDQDPNDINFSQKLFKAHLMPYNISHFPNVRGELPLELLPFQKKLQRVALLQRQNLKEFHKKSIADERWLGIEKGRILQEGMRNDPNYLPPTTINERKVRMWSQMKRDGP